jgi:hypothetical protein
MEAVVPLEAIVGWTPQFEAFGHCWKPSWKLEAVGSRWCRWKQHWKNDTILEAIGTSEPSLKTLKAILAVRGHHVSH